MRETSSIEVARPFNRRIDMSTLIYIIQARDILDFLGIVVPRKKIPMLLTVLDKCAADKTTTGR